MLGAMQQVLVVCMGNICRSPMASAVLQAEVARRGLQEQVAVDSAGVYDGHAGERPDRRAQRVALARGYEAIGRECARGVLDEDFVRFDLILAMDQSNLRQLHRRCPPQQRHKLHLYLHYAGLGEREVPDPYYGPPEGFEVVLGLCEAASGRVLDRLLGIPILGGIVRRKIQKALGLDQCKFAAGGAAPMPPALLQWYARLGIPINEGYGMTENLALSHITESGKNQQGTVGPAYPGVEHRIDPQTGEVQMRSQALMLGYYKEPEKSREAFTDDGWLKTGDKGTIDAGGLLRITGRVKDLFKTGKGKYVAPAPIEDKLVMHDAVEACVVTGANLGQPLGIVMLSPEAAQRASAPEARLELERSLDEHRRAINATLDPHEQMQCVVVVRTPWTVDNDMITPTFKVKRNRIEDVYARSYEAWENSGKTVIFAD